LATLVLALPVALLLILRGEDGTTAEPGTPVTPGTTAPSAGPSTEPPATTPAVPNGRIALHTLQNTTLDIPRWPTDHVLGPHGRLRFRDGEVPLPFQEAGTGRPPYGERLVILAVTYGDVDRDGADETIAEIGCLIEGGSKQLVAFDRDHHGRIITMGPVVATTGEIRDIRTDSARVSDAGTVTASLADYQVCCDDQTPQRWQTRGYRWHDARFQQVSGPTRMTANPAVTETRISASELVLGPVLDGYRYGTLTVTVTHAWGTRPGAAKLIFYSPAGLERAGTAWPPVIQNAGSFTVTVDPPPTRGAIAYRYAFRAADAVVGGHLDIELRATSANGISLSEALPWNDTAASAIRAVN
jgi:hypothetical protein